MSHGLLEILKYFLLALIWLFFLYATRMVYVEVRRSREDRAAASRAAPPPVPAADRPVQLHLRVLEPEERRGRTFELDGEITVGRSPGCAVALEDDTYASSLHARVFERDGEIWLEDLKSRNGTFLNEQKVAGPVRLQRGDRVKVGSTVLEVAR